MNFLRKIDDILIKVMMVIGALAILALMMVATMNVFFRIVDVPFRGAYEIVGFLGAVVIAFALGYTQKRKDHIMVDIATRKFPPTVLKILDALKYIVSAVFFGIVARQVFLWGVNIYRTGEVSETLKIIYYPFVFCVALGFAILAFTLLIDFVFTISRHERD